MEPQSGKRHEESQQHHKHVNDANQINDEMNGEKKQDANKPYRPWRCGKSLFM